MNISKTNAEIEQCFHGVASSTTFGNIVNTFNLSEKSVFDVGCAYGEFLTHFGTGSEGVTIAAEEAEHANKKGLAVHTGNIEDPHFNINKTFDVVFANNILEHLYSPHNFLARSKKLLNKNGILILGVPCIPKIASLVHLRKFCGALASNHINFFTRQTLIKTCERAGWTVQRCRSFHFKNEMLDTLLHPIAPHFYVIATPDENFIYPEKRRKELKGYKDTDYES